MGVVVAAVAFGTSAVAGASGAYGEFIVKCTYDHSAMADPIVYPGQPGASHLHDFYGAKGVTAFTTLSSLRASSTTCADAADPSAYWHPTLYVNGAQVKPEKLVAYYRGNQSTKPYPLGLKIIAGNKNATAPQGDHIVYWNCDSGKYDIPPQCPSGKLQVHVIFPSCWDGQHLDSIDHKRHMAYDGTRAGIGTCPAGYPIHVPALAMLIVWPVTTWRTLSLSSGSIYGMHADYWDAWGPTRLTRFVTSCINALTKCTATTGSTP